MCKISRINQTLAEIWPFEEIYFVPPQRTQNYEQFTLKTNQGKSEIFHKPGVARRCLHMHAKLFPLALVIFFILENNRNKIFIEDQECNKHNIIKRNTLIFYNELPKSQAFLDIAHSQHFLPILRNLFIATELSK